MSHYHIHHGLTQEKFGSEEKRLVLTAPLPTIEATIHTEAISLLFTRKNCFATPYICFLVPRTPTRCSISYRFRGSSSLITPHLLPISNYASASLFWKSTGSYRFPNRDKSCHHLDSAWMWRISDRTDDQYLSRRNSQARIETGEEENFSF